MDSQDKFPFASQKESIYASWLNIYSEVCTTKFQQISFQEHNHNWFTNKHTKQAMLSNMKVTKYEGFTLRSMLLFLKYFY